MLWLCVELLVSQTYGGGNSFHTNELSYTNDAPIRLKRLPSCIIMYYVIASTFPISVLNSVIFNLITQMIFLNPGQVGC